MLISVVKWKLCTSNKAKPLSIQRNWDACKSPLIRDNLINTLQNSITIDPNLNLSEKYNSFTTQISSLIDLLVPEKSKVEKKCFWIDSDVLSKREVVAKARLHASITT